MALLRGLLLAWLLLRLILLLNPDIIRLHYIFRIGVLLWKTSSKHSFVIIPGDWFRHNLGLMLLILNGFSKSRNMPMVLLNGTRLAWLLKASNNGMDLIMKTRLVLLSNPLLSGFCFHWLLLVAGLFANWTFRMLSCMVSWRKKFICGSLLDLLIHLVISICVA
jgi:hypothetical protein